MVTLPLCHLHFQNMTLTSCQTKFSKLLLVSHKTFFCENEAVHPCVTMQKFARELVFNIAFADKKLSFCGRVFKGIYDENEAFPKATS